MSTRYTKTQIDTIVSEIGTRIRDRTTAAAIKTAYEINTNTNAFTDAEQTKLAGIEALADVTDAVNVAAAGAVMETDTDASGFAFVIDEDNLVSNLDTRVPTQQSVKTYVDNVVAGITALTATDIDTLAEINAIITDATLISTTNTDASGFAFVIDEDDLVSNLDTRVPTQQSVKAYVDNVVMNAAGVTNLAWDPVTNTVTSSTGSDAVIPDVTITVDGLMTATDKVKLDGIEAGATNDTDAANTTDAITALDAALV